MNELKDKNQAIRQQNKIAVRELEEFYVNGTIWYASFFWSDFSH